MKEAGIKAFELKSDERSKIYSHENEAYVLDPEFEKQFKANKTAWEFFNNQAPSYKKVIIHVIMSAKQEKTRLSRLEKAIKFSEEQKRML
jgi:uncharacterized protein YdeI (YjbR/CyaY-like superfamily)